MLYFTFCGKPALMKDRPLVEHGTGKNGKPYVKMKFVVQKGSDRAIVEAFAAQQDELRLTDRDRNRFEVPWDERFNEEMVQKANMTYVVGGFGDRKTYLSQYDQILELEKLLDGYNGNIIVTGRVDKSYYNGRWYENYSIRNVYAAAATDIPRLYLRGELILGKGSVDSSTYKDDKTLQVSGYIEQYIDKDHPAALLSQNFTLNASRIDTSDPKQAKALQMRLNALSVKDAKWYKMNWEMVLKNGQEEMEWDETQLTDLQKEAYECGLLSLEDMKPTKRIYGERITEFRLVRPLLKDEYAYGPLEYGDSAFVESMVYHPGQVVQAAETKEDDIFGSDLSSVDDLFA